MEKSLHKMRPRLSTISPLVHWIAIGFIWLNIALAHIIYTAKGAKLVLYQGFLSQSFWAVLFLFLAGSIVYGLLTNRWNVVRRAMVAGLFVKAAFLYAIIVLAYKYGFQAIEGTLYLWLFLVWTQIGAVMFFLPPIPTEHGNDR